MGNVYLSFSRGGRPVAIKVVRQEFADDPEFRRRFAREITAAQRVQGHCTAPVVDADPDAPVPWLATTYIAGPSLQSAVGEYGPFPLFTVFRLLAGVAEGVAAVHAAGLIHRDLKPANVLLAEDGPRVIDFGIAHAANSSTLTGKGSAVGTPGYMAPEQIRGKVSEATDVFALGQLAVYAATGHPAFGEGTTDALFYRILNEPPDLDDCPAELRPIAERCLAKASADRPSVTEVIDFARAAMRGDTMRVVGEPWLPAPVAATLLAYAPGAAPAVPPAPPAASPGQPTVAPPPAPRTGSVTSRRRVLRPALIVTVAALLAVGGYLGYLVGHSGGGAGSPGTANGTGSNQTQQARTPVTPATQVASPPSASASASPFPSDTGPSYHQEWAGRVFTMPGGGCSGGDPSDVTFDPVRGPLVDTSGDPMNSDLYLDCVNSPPGISFNGNQAARVSGSPSPGTCEQAINTSPLADQDVPLAELTSGSQFCVATSQSSQLVLLTLQRLDTSTDSLTWSATAWVSS